MKRSILTKTYLRLGVGLLAIAAVVGACSSTGGSTTAATATQGVAGATATPVAVSTSAPVADATSAPVAGSATVMAQTAGGQTILVAGSNGMTVYTFTSDAVGSGKSACSGGCLVKWPALTVAAGAAPSAGPGVKGTLGTITRADDSSLQVTYNGLPLYFYAGDKAAGDTNGSYPNRNLVKP